MNSTKAHYFKLIGGIVGALILLVCIALVTILLLKSVAPKTSTDSTAVVTPPALSAADTVKAYTGKAVIGALSDTTYNQQSGGSTGASIFYKATNQPYAINAKASDTALFTAKDQSQADDSKIVQSQTEALLASKGFRKITEPARAVPTTSTNTTFENDATVCQLTDTPAAPGFAISHSFACLAKSAVDQEYTSLAKLLDLYKKSNTLGSFTEVTSSTTTEGNKSLTIVGLSTATSYSSLLFAAIDNNWEFIATLSDGNSASSNGKYVPTPALKAALANPKYGDFLQKNVD